MFAESRVLTVEERRYNSGMGIRKEDSCDVELALEV